MRAREPLAIVGMGCRFPGGIEGPESYWRALRDGIDAIVDVPASRWDLAKFYDADPDAPGKTFIRQGGFLRQDLETFDASFFNLSSREAACLDPQQRLLLEVTWEAFEDAGLDIHRFAGRDVGVFVGGFMMDYYAMVFASENRPLIDTYTASGAGATMLSARLAYTFDFTGPTFSVDTACSSSLVALHCACSSVWSGECDLALVGGVNVLMSPALSVALAKARLVSPDWRCKAFDASANGYARGEGAGLVLIRPLSHALAAGDRIYAMVRGTAVNQDGRSEGGITTPSGKAQEALLRSAYARADIAPERVQYVEAHGTGTLVGDRTEATAIGRVLGAGRSADQTLVLGSVKTNFGHLEAAAGVAGLIKCALALHHKEIPRNLHYRVPNPEIAFSSLNLRVADQHLSWPSEDPRIAGVNSFGYGGTNAHAVLEEAPAPSKPLVAQVTTAAVSAHKLVPLSARSETALRASAERLLARLEKAPHTLSFDAVAYTLSERRSHEPWRLSMCADSSATLCEALRAHLRGEARAGLVSGQSRSSHAPKVAWVFTGMGPQWWGMGRQLLERAPRFRQTVEACDTLFAQLGDLSLMRELRAPAEASRMHRTDVAQAANFALQAGLADLYRSWGVEPSVIVGHSVGEVSAAYASGALSLEDAVRISYHRGRLQARTAGSGGMWAVGLPPRDVEPLLDASVSIAAINSPSGCTLAGSVAALARIAASLDERGVFNRPLKVEVPYHSPVMDPLREELLSCLEGLSPRAPTVPMISTVTAREVSAGELGPAYWFRNVRDPVRFADAVRTMLRNPPDAILELGPHPVLSTSIAECMQDAGVELPLSFSLRREEPELETSLGALGHLFLHGLEPRWEAFRGADAHLASLPTQPWQRTRHWRESASSHRDRLGGEGAHPLLGERMNSPLPTWEMELGGSRFGFLQGHKIHGELILPGSAYIEAALAMLRELGGAGQLVLENVSFHEALLLEGETPAKLRCSFDRRSGQFNIGSDRSKNPHVTGQGYWVTDGPEPSEGAASLQEQWTGLADCGSTRDLYTRLQARGYDYGGDFLATERVCAGESRVMSHVGMPAGIRDSVPHYLLHPALLDACFHGFLAADGGGELFLPVGVRRVIFHRKISGALVCEALPQPRGDRALKTVSFRIHDAVTGDLVAELDDLMVKRVGAAAPERAYKSWLYRFEWREAPALATHLNAPGVVLVLGETALGRKLVDTLSAAGAQASEVSDGALRDCLERLRAEGVAPTLVYCAGTDAAREEDATAPDAAISSSVSLLTMVQALAALRGATLNVVTRGATSVDGTKPVHSGYAALVGMLRVAKNEHAENAFRWLDIDPRGAADELESLCAELASPCTESEVALRDRRRFVHRFVKDPDLLEVPGARAQGASDRFVLRANPKEAWAYEALAEVPLGDDELEIGATCVSFDPRSPWVGCCGRVVRIGRALPAHTLGKRVFCVATQLGSHVRVRAERATPVPDGWTDEDAAARAAAFVAFHALVTIAQVQRDERILIHSDSLAFIEAARSVAEMQGASGLVIAVDDETLRRACLARGHQDVLNLSAPRFSDRALALAGAGGYQVLIRDVQSASDTATGMRAWTRLIGLLADDGRVAVVRPREAADGAWQVSQRPLSMTTIDPTRLFEHGDESWRKFTRAIDTSHAELLVKSVPTLSVGAEELLERLGKEAPAAGCLVDLEDARVPVRRAPESPLFVQEGSYVITGGLGGFGLETARWLAEHGAGTLVLVSRRETISPEVDLAIERVRAQGARVLLAKADVGVSGDLRRALSSLPNLPPVRGVFHAAAELTADDFLVRVEAQTLRRMMQAKVLGAWNVCRELRDQPLDHVVFFSSVAAQQGSTSLGCYAAANAFLDGFAEELRSQGIGAVSVNWGAVADVGVLAQREDFRRSADGQGMIAHDAAELLEGLDPLLRSAQAGYSLADIDWRRFAGQYPRLVSDPRFAETFASMAGDVRSSQGSVLDAIRSAAAERQGDLVLDYVKRTVARLFGTTIESTPEDTSLRELGLDSLLASQLKTAIERDTHLPFQVMTLLKGPTIAELSQVILHQLREACLADTSVGRGVEPDLELHARLDEDVRPVATWNRERALRPRNILLTGATGFLGSFLLRELLRRTDARIHCLVRAATPEAGADRIRATMKKYRVDAWNGGRVVPVCGDISRPRLGLAQESYDALAEEIDVVYHSAALLNFLFDYEAFYETNVLGTTELLRFACRHHTKAFHHISTTFFFTTAHAGERPVRVPEEDSLDLGRGCLTGYAQSKWVAERRALEARRRGLPVTVYRPPLIVGHSETGACNETDIFSRLLLGLAELGEVQDVRVPMDVAAIDEVADHIVQLSLTSGAIGRSFNLSHPEPAHLSDLANAVRESGFSVQEVPLDRWLSTLETRGVDDKRHALAALQPFFTRRWADGQVGLFDLLTTAPRLESTLASELLGMATRPADWGAVAKRSLRFLRESGKL